MTNQKFIWINEAADLLGIKRMTLYAWIRRNEEIRKKNPNELTESDKRNKCPSYGKMGSRYRFKLEDIQKFIEESMNHEGS